MSSATATAQKGAVRVPRTFKQLMSVANKPISERPLLPIGRNGAETIVRRHFLKPKKVRALKEVYLNGDPENDGAGKGVIPNPHNSGSYRYFVQALIDLGPDKMHLFPDVKAKMRELMGGVGEGATTSLWNRFMKKESRNEETGKDVNGRIQQNAKVLQRVGGTAANQYGYKLFQVGKEILGTAGMVIDILKVAKDGGHVIGYRLNTDSATPFNEFARKPKVEEDEAPAEEPVKSAKRKAGKVKQVKVAVEQTEEALAV